jgi:hypothetical protein
MFHCCGRLDRLGVFAKVDGDVHMQKQKQKRTGIDSERGAGDETRYDCYVGLSRATLIRA